MHSVKQDALFPYIYFTQILEHTDLEVLLLFPIVQADCPMLYENVSRVSN